MVVVWVDDEHMAQRRVLDMQDCYIDLRRYEKDPDEFSMLLWPLVEKSLRSAHD